LVRNIVASVEPKAEPPKVRLRALSRPHVAGASGRVEKEKLVGQFEEREARLVQHGANGDAVGCEARQAGTELEGGCRVQA
jgi:hypothetical protein